MQVMLAVLVTTVVVVALTIFAVQTKWDFTMMGGFLFAALLLFVTMSLVLSFMPSGQTGVLILSSIGALIFSLYLIRK